jgi:FkbM family methyltransferase
MHQALSAAKRQVKHLLEWALDVRIVHPDGIALLFEQEHLRHVFQEFQVDCLFDVGANEGQYAEMVRAETGYTGPIVSFEPVPRAHHVLAGKAAGDSLWYAHQIALSDVAGPKSFHMAADSQFSSFHGASAAGRTEFEHKIAAEEAVHVEASTLAAEFDKVRQQVHFNRPFLKMDTQGHDVAVARGAGATLEKFVGLQSELAVMQLYEGMPSFIEALSYFRDRGFYLSALVPNNSGHFPHLMEIDCIMLNERASAPAG